MPNIQDWPGLSNLQNLDGQTLQFDHAVIGKVHNSRRDFGLIGRSKDFTGHIDDFHIGGENKPEKFCCWKTVNNQCYAISCYPSQAVDVHGRRGFLEKQILQCTHTGGNSNYSILNALITLPLVTTLTDEIWWGDSNEIADSQDAYQKLSPISTKVNYDQIVIVVNDGQRWWKQLRNSIETLTRIYTGILTQQFTFIENINQPLTPEALAVMLLCGPQNAVKTTSISGWFPSLNLDYQRSSKCWGVININSDVSVSKKGNIKESQYINESTSQLAEIHAKALLENDPNLLHSNEKRGTPVPKTGFVIDNQKISSEKIGKRFLISTGNIAIPKPSSGSPTIVKELHNFANTVEIRVFSVDQFYTAFMKSPAINKSDRLCGELITWLKIVRDRKPSFVSEKQNNTKIAMLRAAILTIAPYSNVDKETEEFQDNAISSNLYLKKEDIQQYWHQLYKNIDEIWINRQYS